MDVQVEYMNIPSTHAGTTKALLGLYLWDMTIILTMFHVVVGSAKVESGATP